MDFKTIKRLVKLVNSSGIAEIEVREDTQTIRVRRTFEQTGQAQQYFTQGTEVTEAKGAASPLPASTEASSGTHEAFAEKPDLPPDSVAVKAPMVGTFYISPSPDAQPFAKTGQQVNKGDTLCIVEAMKTMNEIPAPKDGVVISILANNSTGVEYGQTLMILDTS